MYMYVYILYKTEHITHLYVYTYIYINYISYACVCVYRPKNNMAKKCVWFQKLVFFDFQPWTNLASEDAKHDANSAQDQQTCHHGSSNGNVAAQTIGFSSIG